MTLPSEKLQKRISPMRASVIGAAALVVIAGGAIGIPAAVHAGAPTTRVIAAESVPTAAPCDGTSVGQGECISDDEQAQADQQLAQLEADNAAKAKAAADVAAAQAAAEQAAAEQAAKDAAAKKSAPRVAAPRPGGDGGLPSGSVVPQPNGYPDTTQCASGSASTVNGVPTCD